MIPKSRNRFSERIMLHQKKWSGTYPLGASFPLVGAGERGNVPPHRVSQRLLAVACDHAVEKVAIDRVEGERLERLADADDLFGRERDQIWIAAHEAQKLAVDGDSRDIGRAQHAAAFRALAPVQHGAARKMSAASDQRDIRQELEGFALPVL